MSTRTTPRTSGTVETRVELDDRVPAIRITREFAAGPDAVFRAHTDPDLLARWLGPRELTMEIDRFDCRTGGSYRYTHHQGEETYGFFGSFHEVRPDDHVIVQTFTFEGAPDSVAIERLQLTDRGGGRTRLEVTSLLDSFEARDGMVANGMEQGITEGYEQLDELIAAQG